MSVFRQRGSQQQQSGLFLGTGGLLVLTCPLAGGGGRVVGGLEPAMLQPSLFNL